MAIHFEQLCALPAADTLRTGWVTRHNTAVLDYIKGRVGASNGGRRTETAILSLIDGWDSWLGSGVDVDGFSGPHVVWPIACAMNDALNYDLGRLDGGTLHRYIRARLESVGINPDTGEWL